MADIESLNFDIRLEARQAITTLEELATKTSTFGERVRLIQAELKKFSTATGMSFKSAKGVFQEIDKTLSETGKGSILFGEMVKQGWAEVGNGAEQVSNKWSLSSKAMTIAFGMLIHQGINLLINAFQKLFSLAIKGLNEMEAAMFNIANAEQRLSEQGLDVTIEGLKGIIAEVQKLNPMLSKFQATELVSVLSSKVAPALNLTEEDMGRLAKQIAILAVRNQALGKSFEEVEQQVVTGLLSGRVTAGINQLGVKITEQAVQEEVLRKGLVKTTEEYKNLTSAEKEHADTLAIISILEKNTATEEQNLPAYLQTASGLMGVAKAKLSDLMTTIGQTLAPLIKSFFRVLIDALTQMNIWLEKNKGGLTSLFAIWGRAFEALAPILMGIGKIIIFLSNGIVISLTAASAFLDKISSKFPAIKKILDGLVGNTSFTDTPTAQLMPEVDDSKYKNAVKKSEEEITKIFQEARDKRIEIDRDYQNKLQDLALDNSRKLEDIARKQAQQISDANRDYAEKVSDINRDAEQQEQDARADANRRSVEIERKYQEELKNLREKYLLDLEDALHERDARQILHLMRQYEIDKKHAQEERSTEQKRSQEQLQLKLKDIEQNRKLKLEEAKRDLENKIKDIKLSAARERQEAAINYNRQLADARLAHQRALEEQRLYLQKKLKDLADALAKEYNMTASQLQALQALYTGMSIVTNNATGSPYSPASINAGTYTPPPNSGFSGSGLYGTTGLAQGGSYLARTPHSINVAEQGPELIQATPLNRIGGDINKLFAQAGSTGGESMTGQLEIGVTLSPDLEARLISKTLNKTADVILKVNRSKV